MCVCPAATSGVLLSTFSPLHTKLTRRMSQKVRGLSFLIAAVELVFDNMNVFVHTQKGTSQWKDLEKRSLCVYGYGW